MDVIIRAIVDELAPELVSRTEVGYESAAQLLIMAGNNLGRFGSEASFAALCGVSTIPASSGKVQRHRLNRGENQTENSALHIIAIGLLPLGANTQAYIARQVAEGHSKLEAIRFLKRYIARELYYVLRNRHLEINYLEGLPGQSVCQPKETSTFGPKKIFG